MESVEFGSIVSIKKGKKPARLTHEPQFGFMPYIDIEAFETGNIKAYADGEKCLSCRTGDVIIVCDGSRSGFVGRAIDGYLGSTLAVISANGMSEDYLYYFLQGKYTLLNTKKRGTGTPHLDQQILFQQKLNVPSLPEQQRIVARIEELFSELDNGVKTLEKTKQQLAVYRQAVLKWAFEGAYTEQWRKIHPDVSPIADFYSIKKDNPTYKDTSGDENEISIEMPISWLKIRIGDVFDVEVGATPSRRVSEYWNGDIPWVSSGEVHFNSIETTHECITQDGLDHSSTNVQPIGTVMLAMIGEGKTRGQAAVLSTPAAHNQNTAAILVSKTPCHPLYVFYFLQMNYNNTRRVGSGNNQKALNKERVRALRFPFPSFAEQARIVQEIEFRLSVCESIEKTINAALQQAEAMRQSILKQAFEGRL